MVKAFLEVVSHKLGQSSPWCSNEGELYLWDGGLEDNQITMAKTTRNSSIRGGDGTNSLFWKEDWIGQAPFQEAYPDLMILSSHREATIFESRSKGWNLGFRRHLSDREIDRVTTLLHEVEDFPGTTI
ncbi:hypothetical protein H5410_041674 [Solanum commersonii]|uniref:Uncharacterized protein n=1 Tax=Solanum commersonii TaxID=4109 RepID=A0A9J5XVE7_SOLCO|nr:hypothetical protein H5410_041674 [Solanum commersonii]